MQKLRFQSAEALTWIFYPWVFGGSAGIGWMRVEGTLVNFVLRASDRSEVRKSVRSHGRLKRQEFVDESDEAAAAPRLTDSTCSLSLLFPGRQMKSTPFASVQLAA